MLFGKNKPPQRVNGHEHAFLKNYPGSSSFAESYRTFRTNVNLSFLEREYNSLLLTSASQKEGKTNIVANLAYTMAKAGQSVLMVDADLRNPALSRAFRSKPTAGLTGLITEDFNKEIERGKLEDLSPSDLIRLIAMQKRTGCLVLVGGGEMIELLFHNGRLKDLYWTTRPDHKRLGEVLVSQNLVTSDQVNQAFQQQAVTGQRLGLSC